MKVTEKRFPYWFTFYTAIGNSPDYHDADVCIYAKDMGEARRKAEEFAERHDCDDFTFRKYPRSSKIAYEYEWD